MRIFSRSCSIQVYLIAIGLLVALSLLKESRSLRKRVGISLSTVRQKNETNTTKVEVYLHEQQNVQPEHVESEQQAPDTNMNKTIGGNSKKQLQIPFHLCTEKVINLDNIEISTQYQCAGDHYDEFARAMHSLADTLPEPMGRREFPVSSNKNVLVMGNSHTRQMISALVCQYRNKITQFEPNPMRSNATGSIRVGFANNSTLTSLTNNPIPYSPEWPQLIETMLGRPLNSYDGIVLGKFNTYEESKGTNFLATMTEALKSIPGNIDFSKTKPPSLRDVAKVYHGSVVYVSMFARYGNSELKENLEYIYTVNSTRHNLSTISGRKYIDKLNMECGAMSVQSTDLCYEDGDKNVSREANTMHRCTGAQGGHPDLMAWEVAEKLNKIK